MTKVPPPPPLPPDHHTKWWQRQPETISTAARVRPASQTSEGAARATHWQRLTLGVGGAAGYMDLAGCVSASQRRVPSATAPKTSAKLGNVSLVIGHKSRQVAKVDVAVPHQDVIVSSHAVQRVTALPHGTDPKDVPIHSRDVATPAKSLDTAPSVPWWAILAGLLLLLLLLTLLPWKVSGSCTGEPRWSHGFGAAC
ncbi:uncharacterized protein LOC126993828 isoform X1 [Eriocheir sinensis]|uniref:uncharacterized protein LOC126993828 isoform X1 n=1 Tax=Eriocheir sinensis TaxID=95602 RepID=UPI0021C91C1B|nr:uncharacterized protein LOC126993828 isoform X1 [Eriocheir sinensis]